MLLKVSEFLTRKRQREHSLFTVAYFWKFQKYPDLREDVAQFKLHGVVPAYVLEYIDAMEAKEKHGG